MSEPNRLRRAFDDLRTEALPRISPPGVEAARRTVRRRRARRVTVAGVAAGAVAVLAVGTFARPWLWPTASPMSEQIAELTPSASASPTPSPAPSTPVPSDEPIIDPGQGGRPSCAEDGLGIPSTAGDGAYTMKFFPIKAPGTVPCPGVRIKVWLAYYDTGPDGARTLRTTEISYLTEGKPSLPMRPVGGPCVSWLIGSGTGPIPTQLPDGEDWINGVGPGGPFWDADHAQSGIREVSLDSSCGSASPSPTPTAAEPTPTP